MSLAQTILKSYRDLQESWARKAESAFGKPIRDAHDEAAAGEFISPFITERGLSFPVAARQERPTR